MTLLVLGRVVAHDNRGRGIHQLTLAVPADIGTRIESAIAVHPVQHQLLLRRLGVVSRHVSGSNQSANVWPHSHELHASVSLLGGEQVITSRSLPIIQVICQRANKVRL